MRLFFFNIRAYYFLCIYYIHGTYFDVHIHGTNIFFVCANIVHIYTYIYLCKYIICMYIYISTYYICSKNLIQIQNLKGVDQAASGAAWQAEAPAMGDTGRHMAF